MRINFKKIGQAILKGLTLATQIFKIYKLFTKGGDCEKGKDGNENERNKRNDNTEKDGQKER